MRVLGVEEPGAIVEVVEGILEEPDPGVREAMVEYLG
jgi:hypothetical protein